MRFYLPDINKSRPELTGDAHTHATYSLRIRVGDYITVFDGKGTEYSCKVTDIKKDRTSLEILDTVKNAGEAKINVSLYLSIIKQDRFELAVQKITELGVNRIVPVYSTYSQRNITLNYNRLNKIAISACEQCGRSTIPQIEQCIEFDELLKRTSKTNLIVPWERELNGRLKDAIDKTNTDISIFIGPEGGITPDEQQKLVDAGAKSVTLGARILRAETAAIATAAAVYYEMGEWNL